MELTRILLNLQKVPKPDDTADALAIAICHAHSSGSQLGRLYLEQEISKRVGVPKNKWSGR